MFQKGKVNRKMKSIKAEMKTDGGRCVIYKTIRTKYTDYFPKSRTTLLVYRADRTKSGVKFADKIECVFIDFFFDTLWENSQIVHGNI
jgi:hypothetical protein